MTLNFGVAQHKTEDASVENDAKMGCSANDKSDDLKGVADKRTDTSTIDDVVWKN